MGTLRFHNQDTVWRVDDRRDVPKPKPPVGGGKSYAFESYYQQVHWVLGVPAPTRARDINALGDVPDSTWFENRVGRGDLTVEQVRRGPNVDAIPQGTWTITRTKSTGSAPGFLIKDDRGVKFLVKFDHRDEPEMETAAHVITHRLLWALGYHVPEDSITYFDRTDLAIASDATTLTAGKKRPLTDADVDAMLAAVARTRDGRYRALTSKFLPGKPVGTYNPQGTRRDDPNDRIPHEHMRTLRAQYVFFGWLGHTDVHQGNRLDMWVEDPERPGHHFLMHYLLDFGQALGVMAHKKNDPWDNYAHKFDYAYSLGSVFTLGLWKRPWEGDVRGPDLPTVGRLESERFDPAGFAPRTYYTPFRNFDEFDGFWAAKTLLQLSPAHISAAVEVGEYSDPRAAAYVVRTLIERQRISARHFLGRLTPLAEFEVVATPSGEELCAVDLLRRHRLVDGSAPWIRYRARAFDYEGRRRRWRGRPRPQAKQSARVCFPDLRPPAARDGYTIVRIDGSRGDEALGPTFVHLARPHTHSRVVQNLRVIGIRRERAR